MPGPFDLFAPLLAQNNAGAPAAGGSESMFSTVLLFLPIIVLFYFLMLRPQQAQEKKRRAMIDALKKNDRVLTAAGIYGTVVSIDTEDDRVVLRVDDDKGVKLAFTKAGIVRVLDEPAGKEAAKA